MELHVRIEKNLPAITPNAISFETGITKDQLENPSIVAYDHHGPEFYPSDKGALPTFYEDLILGREMPTVFATPKIRDIDTLLAIALFIHRDLPLHPNTASTVYIVDFIHRLGIAALVHLDKQLALFFSALRQYFPDTGLTQKELSDRVQNTITWLREYIYNGTLTITPPPDSAPVTILKKGSAGFVLAETSGRLIDGWIELFRNGFLRGVLTKVQGDKNHVLVARKSLFLAFDLTKACQILNQMEIAMGEFPGWKVSPDALWLESPEEGTLILIQHLLDVLIRV